MTIQAIKEILSKIKPPKNREDEDGCIDINGWAGGNIDDAYELGMDDGEAMLAERLREIIAKSEAA